MSRLTRYLVVQYARDSLALFVVACILVWLIQMLRLFDLITAKGQGLMTLFGQAFLATPPLARQIIYICLAIGLARAFKALQESRELHTIHVAQRMRAIWTALGIYVLAGAVFALVVAHWAEPAARRESARWTAQIAAELLGQNLVPNRFTEVADGVVLHIGGRLPDGTITDFFADDSRVPDIRRTYFADTAIIVSNDDGYQISLRNGRLQMQPKDDKYSEIEFARYELALESLTQTAEVQDSRDDHSTWQLFEELPAAEGKDRRTILKLLHDRFAEGPRVISICLLVASLLAFPHARRGRDWMPNEVLVLLLAFAERAASNLVSTSMPEGAYLGPLLMFGAAVLILLYRFRTALLPQRRRAAA